MQKHWGHVGTGDMARVNLVEGTSHLENPRESSEKRQGKGEANKQKQR